MVSQINSSVKSSLSDISAPKKEDLDIAKSKKFEDPEVRIKRQKKEFFTLLTTQLKHQDPSSPMDTNQMTAQMFAINGVEQQLETNRNLENILKAISYSQINNGIGYIGKTAHFSGNKVQVVNNDAEFKYSIREEISEARIVIKDDKGEVVHQASVSTNLGENIFSFSKEGISHIKDGIYSFNIIAFDKANKQIPIKTYGNGVVESVVTDEGKSYLEIAGEYVDLKDVYKLSNSKSKNQAIQDKFFESLAQGIDQTQSNMNSVQGVLEQQLNGLNQPTPDILEKVQKMAQEVLTS